MLRHLIETSAHKVTERVTAKRIPAQKHNVDQQNEASDSNSETIRKEEGPYCVVGEEAPDDVGESQKVAMEIL
jgi:hypothetical protein